MKIIIYTTSDCQFSKTEKEYLTSHKLPFEEKNLEINKEFLTEMLAVGNNFAGTPVTKIEKDDGTSVVLKGFTKEEFDAALGFATEPTKPEAKKAEPQATEVKTKDVPKTTSSVPAVASQPPVPTPQPTQAPQTDPALNSLIDKLENKTTPPTTPVTPQTPQNNSSSPSIPDFPVDSATQPAK